MVEKKKKNEISLLAGYVPRVRRVFWFKVKRLDLSILANLLLDNELLLLEMYIKYKYSKVK